MLRCKSCDTPLTYAGAGEGAVKCYYCGALTSPSPVLLYNLSLETMGNMATVLIPNQTPLPHTTTEGFSTASDYQESIQIHLLEGNNWLANQNRSLGKFQVIVDPPRLRGVPQIDVSFSISPDGELSITALNHETGNKQVFYGMMLSVV